MSSAGFVSHYTQIARNGTLDAKLKAAMSFWRFSEDAGKRVKLARDGALDSIINILNELCDLDTETVLPSRPALMRYNTDVSILSDGLETLNRQNFSEDKALVTLYAVSALCNLSKTCEIVRDIVIEKDCFPLLVRLMSHDSLGVQLKAVECVGNLASQKLSCLRFIRQGALLALLGLIRPIRVSIKSHSRPSSALSRSSSYTGARKRPASSLGGRMKSLSELPTFTANNKRHNSAQKRRSHTGHSIDNIFKKKVTQQDVLVETFKSLSRIYLERT